MQIKFHIYVLLQVLISQYIFSQEKIEPFFVNSSVVEVNNTNEELFKTKQLVKSNAPILGYDLSSFVVDNSKLISIYVNQLVFI